MVVEPWVRRGPSAENGRAGPTKGHATGRPHARVYTLLQQARGTEACNRINNRNRLPLEDPAGHRIAQRCVTNVDYLHAPPKPLDALSLGGVR